MSQSTAHYVPYDIRPSKQIERRIMLDILKVGSEAGLKLSTHEYIGFGGFKFYDFEMLFRHLGIKSMTSVEQDKSIFRRCKFNKPFGFITVKESLFSDYLAGTKFGRPIVAWLDYDWALSRTVVSDILELGGKVPVGSFVFITIRADLPRGQETSTPDDRVAALKNDLGEFAHNPSNEDVESSKFPEYAGRVLTSAVTAGLSKRSDGEFLLLLRTLYRDSVRMLTVGACLCPKGIANDFSKRLRANFSFLCSSDGPPYAIPELNYTLRERHLLDLVVTSKTQQKKARRNLLDIGIRASAIDDYKRIARFVPKYFESYT